MAGEFCKTLEQILSEAKKPSQNNGSWGITRGSLFDQSLLDNLRTFPNLPDKLNAFTDTKIQNPLSSRFGKHDSPMTGPLVGFWHCHLRDDAFLIYLLKNRCIHLVYIASHSEIKGKRAKLLKSRFKSSGELPESTPLKAITKLPSWR